MRKLAAFAATGITFMAVACGGGSSAPRTQNPPPASATLIVSPASATLPLGASRSFSVRASSGTTPAVTWSVNGVAGGNAEVGTITDKGFYSAPDSFPADNTVTVTATAVSNPSQRGNANVTVVYPNRNDDGQGVPIKLGTSGGNNTDFSATTCCSGTLGALVRRDGGLFILSNNHVIAKSDKGEAGDPIGQPGLADTNCEPAKIVANLTQKAPLKTGNVDAAIARIVGGQVDTSGNILALGNAGSTSIAAAPPSSTLADPAAVLAAGGRVAKSGRSSGLTCSTLQSVSTNVSVEYEESCGASETFTVTFTDQVVVAGGEFSMSGDSGALIVTAENARPVALLFAGSETNTVGNPINDVLNALKDAGGNKPSIVGGGDHAVSCAPTATAQSATAPAGTSASSVEATELERARQVKERFAARLMSDPAVQAVGIGASQDQPGRAAITIYVRDETREPLPPALEGVRTRVLRTSPFAARAGGSPAGDESHPLGGNELRRGLAVKQRHAQRLLREAGILGVGVGRSLDAPGESAVVVYVEKGKRRASVPPVLDGVRTRVVETERFRAYGWNETPRPRACKPSR